MNKNGWEKTKFVKRIRISEENLDFINKTKQKKSMAGRLNEIINKYRSGSEKRIIK